MSKKPLTRAQLAAELADLQNHFSTLRIERDAAVQGGTDLRKKLDDLKQRLAFAEEQNQRMRGYLERVQEDDVVREELITTGAPDGKQHLVPKRKPTIFAPQMHAAAPAHSDNEMALENYHRKMVLGDYRGRAAAAPRHWVNY